VGRLVWEVHHTEPLHEQGQQCVVFIWVCDE
jgi:hypothetical protein